MGESWESLESKSFREVPEVDVIVGVLQAAGGDFEPTESRFALSFFRSVCNKYFLHEQTMMQHNILLKVWKLNPPLMPLQKQEL